MRASYAISIAALAALAGCTASSQGGGGLSEQLGIVTPAPDEFLIVSNAPLRMPPSFDLPAPQPGAPSPLETNPETAARATLFQTTETGELAAASTGEQILINSVAVQGDTTGIREELAGESPEEGERKYGLTSIAGFEIPADIDDPESVLSPEEEVEALRQRGYRTPAAPPQEDDG